MNAALRNPHLPGETFFLKGGPVGVLLCHGYTATTAEVRLLGDYLHARGYTVSAPLLPGHGTTPQEMNRCHWQDWADALESAYTALAARCDKVFAGGESMGGLLTLNLASRHPEVLGVMVYAAALKLPSATDELAIKLLHWLMPLGTQKGDDDSAAGPRWQGYPCNPLPAARQMLKLQEVVTARLHKVAQPILITQGRLDTAVAAEAPEMIAAGVSSEDKTIRWFEESTHCVLLDQEWEAVAALSLDFIERVLAAPSA